jgi:NAD-dependent deacetylase
MNNIPLLLGSSKRIAILTGAGVSAESGVPTFRDALTGLWSSFNPEQLATPQAFVRDPALVSRWYDERRCRLFECKPNPGHQALARLQSEARTQGRTVTLITQNVDRLHQAAGSTDVIELHGTLWLWRCVDCGKQFEEHGPAFEKYPPTCACAGFKRPGVVWFGENLPEDSLLKAREAAGACDLFLTLGTSSVVHPAAGLIDVALAHGAKVLEINPDPTPYSALVTWSIRGKTGEVLPKLVSEALESTSGYNPKDR